MAGPAEVLETTLECWLPAGSGQLGGAAAPAAAAAVLNALKATLPPRASAEVELTTAHVRFVIRAAAPEAVRVAASLPEAVLTSPSLPTAWQLPPPRWLHAASLGPWIAGEEGAPADVAAFHRRHYRADALVLVLGGHAAPASVREALAEALARRAAVPPDAQGSAAVASQAASSSPDGGTLPQGTATETLGAASAPQQPSAGRWACISVEGPAPEAWTETAALAVAGEVLAHRLGATLQRPVHVALEAWPGRTWLLIAAEAPPPDVEATITTQLAALRDDTVDLSELEQARRRVRATLGDPGHEAGARRRALGWEALSGLPGGTGHALTALAQLGRAEVQAAAQRFCCGAGLRLRLPGS
ncbi:MAG: hypothetical protein VKS61_17315 [Candidatus Sericytochromatia bacterium]|nr:hypothetical protein [Candidatus Sericytochromatia bacterium]